MAPPRAIYLLPLTDLTTSVLGPWKFYIYILSLFKAPKHQQRSNVYYVSHPVFLSSLHLPSLGFLGDGILY